jgi:N-acetylmuramoyl-L-alanine amidase
MRIVILLFCFAANLFVQAQSPTAPLEKFSLFGRDYVRITDWARANKFRLQWVQTEKQLRATNTTARLLFDMDSRRAQINGINFVLSLPVILQKKTVYISAVDLQMTLQPILFPEKNPTNTTIKTICLDPGHGGRDPGNLDGRMQEKKYTLLLAAEVERLLKQAGFKVVTTRKRDSQYPELEDRPKIANQNDADLFVSLHYNAAANRSVEGTEVYCLTPAGTSSSNGGTETSTAPRYPAHTENAKNVLLAYYVQKALVKNLNVEDRGVKRSQFVVLFNPKCPAILIEAGFMTNPGESKRIYDSAYRKRMALAIVDGILTYKKIVER